VGRITSESDEMWRNSEVPILKDCLPKMSRGIRWSRVGTIGKAKYYIERQGKEKY